jgi:hypothetical protein
MSFHIKILKNPLLTWANPETQKTLLEIVSFKTEGYGRKFEDQLKVIPLDVFEFVGTHILLYLDGKIVLGYKSVLRSDCSRMNLGFPPYSIIAGGGTAEHLSAYKTFLELHGEKKLAYDSHLTVSNAAAANPELLYECLEILFALVFHQRHEEAVDFTFMNGAIFAGTHKTFQKMGSKPFAGLGPITVSGYDKREAYVMLCEKKFSEKSIRLAEKYRGLWLARTVISEEAQKLGDVA